LYLKTQLWRLKLASAKDPKFRSEKRADEGELVKVESRQLDGIGRNVL
jgi:hypothetical protein